jgi:CheY-like chemotaxis protein
VDGLEVCRRVRETAAVPIIIVSAETRSADFPVVQLPPGFQIEKVVGGLTYPTSLTWDDQGQMYVAEAGGAFLDLPAPSRILQVDQGQAAEVGT